MAAGVEFHISFLFHPRPALRSAQAAIHKGRFTDEIPEGISWGFVFAVGHDCGCTQRSGTDRKRGEYCWNRDRSFGRRHSKCYS
jgi:hypothetical protein